MGIFSRLRAKRIDINLGYSNYRLLPKSEADAMSLGIRLENNRPRYLKQAKSLLESGEIEVAAKGIILRYSKEGKGIALAISRDDGLSFDKLREKTLPRGKKETSDAILLMMAQTEVDLWP